MLKKLLLAACVSIAAALAVVASGPAGAQSVTGDRSEGQPRIATAPQPTPADAAPSAPAAEEPLDPVPSESTAPEQEPESSQASGVSETTAPGASETSGTKASEPAGSTAPAATETAAPAPAAGPAPATAPAPAAQVAEVDPIVAQVREQLAAAKQLRDATTAERTALVAFYADRSAPIWVAADGFTARARHAMAEIAKADDWGLSAKDFTLPVLAAGDLAPAALAKAEITLGVAVLKYARYARGGRLDPAQVSRNFDQKVTLRDPKVVLETVAGIDSPGGYLRALHPQHPQFELLRQALLKLRAGAGQQPEAEKTVHLPNGPALKLGMTHPDVALLRQRLKVTAAAGADEIYDQQVKEAVEDFQRKNGMKPDGVLGPRTRLALNGGDKPAPAYGSEEQRLIVNMERWRWMPEDLGELHVWDNIPEFVTRVMRNGHVIHQAKIVVGKVDTQTTIFSANMRYIVFGPEWGVPDSIKVKELLPYLRPTNDGPGFFGFGGGGITDTSILERQNLRVSLNGQPVDPSQIDFSHEDIRKYSFIQASGPGNALGLVKFRFPNKHDIYMHDTPQRELFERTVRAYSHGCMRVQNPERLAEVLLQVDKGWSAGRVHELMERGGNNEVPLTKQIPVHITYFTMVASEDGQVHSFGDIYGHDKRVAMALAGRPLPLEQIPTLTVDGFPTREDAKETPRQPRYGQSQKDLFSALFGN
jgi:murein L,D-transpeptidase YcbB/YkuD